MNETPLHEPLIAEEGKEKERVFTGTPERIVNICLASISALIIYWTVYVSADVMWKHGLYIMTVFCMTLVIYPFEKKPKVNHVSLVDLAAHHRQHRRFGLRHLGISGSLHAAGHVDGNGYLLRLPDAVPRP